MQTIPVAFRSLATLPAPALHACTPLAFAAACCDATSWCPRCGGDCNVDRDLDAFERDAIPAVVFAPCDTSAPSKSRGLRAQLATEANALAEDMRGSFPTLDADSGPETIAAWLQSCDPNGCHTAERAHAEGFDAYDHDAAWDALSDMLAGS